MEVLCGPFRPELLPDWFSKVGPAIAALVAVGVFAMSRWYVRRDLRAKRKILRAMLVGHIHDALYFATTTLSDLEPLANGWTPHAPHWAMEGEFDLPGCDRLLDLQGELLGVADDGDETVAVFIEACRSFRHRIDALSKLGRGQMAGMPNNVPKMIVIRAVKDAQDSLREVRATGAKALMHLERLVGRRSDERNLG